MASMIDLSSSTVTNGHQQHQQQFDLSWRRASTVSTSSSISTASATTARRASLASLMLPSRMPLAPLGPQMTPAFALAEQSPTPTGTGSTTHTPSGFATFMAGNSSVYHHGSNSNHNGSASSLLIAGRRPSLSDDAVAASPYGHSHVNGATTNMSRLPRYVSLSPSSSVISPCRDYHIFSIVPIFSQSRTSLSHPSV